MGFTVLIPARLASTRLPDKPLADIAGLPMVVRVAQRAAQSQASQVVVATDNDRIHAACEAHGLRCVLTRPDHPTGSQRVQGALWHTDGLHHAHAAAHQVVGQVGCAGEIVGNAPQQELVHFTASLMACGFSRM